MATTGKIQTGPSAIPGSTAGRVKLLSAFVRIEASCRESSPTVRGSIHQVKTAASQIKFEICVTLSMAVVLVPSTLRGLYIVLQ